MTISEFIKVLESAMEVHGDVPLYCESRLSNSRYLCEVRPYFYLEDNNSKLFLTLNRSYT